MKAADLHHEVLTKNHLRYYEKRSRDFSGRFLRWFLEHIFRLDPIDADDACVDAKHDKGIDAIFVDDVSETIYVVQAKTKTSNKKSTLGDTEIKAFVGALVQLQTPEAVGELIVETKNERLKQALTRGGVQAKLKAGYALQGVFIANVEANNDAKTYVAKTKLVDLYDSVEIAEQYVDLEVDGGVAEQFYFDTSDADVIEYTAGEAAARIFLAPALNLVKMSGISDGRLFEQNVRLSLGNTKVNRSLRDSIQNKAEHNNFPLYHNGINVLCKEIVEETDEKIVVDNYVVVNGAQSLTSLLAEKSKISDGLKILVKLIEVKGDMALSQAITTNSNNQNAIKARDNKSNHNIQQRLKIEVAKVSDGKSAYEIKQGEDNKGKDIISNENAGLVLLAMDRGQPWNCHQKYKIMDELHSDIFGRPGVTGSRVYALWKCFETIYDTLKELDNTDFAYYTLTRYFLAYSVVQIIRDSAVGSNVIDNLDVVVANGNLSDFVDAFENLASSAASDLNAEIPSSDDDEEEYFDYKNDLKSQKWCKRMAGVLLAQHKKDIKRKKIEAVDDTFAKMLQKKKK